MNRICPNIIGELSYTCLYQDDNRSFSSQNLEPQKSHGSSSYFSCKTCHVLCFFPRHQALVLPAIISEVELMLDFRCWCRISLAVPWVSQIPSHHFCTCQNWAQKLWVYHDMRGLKVHKVSKVSKTSTESMGPWAELKWVCLKMLG